MSTIFFDADELGNVAAALVAAGTPVVAAASLLGAYSALNHQAYVTAYPSEADGEGSVSEAEIAAWAGQIAKDGDVSADKALGMLGLALYNLDAFVTPAAIQSVNFMIRMLGGKPRHEVA